MPRLHVTIFFLVIIKACMQEEIFTSPKLRLSNEQVVQNLKRRILTGVGYLPIEEIVRKINLTNTKLIIREKSHATVNIIIKGSDTQVRQIPYYRIMKNMRQINKIHLPIKRKMLLWSIIKEHKPIQNMQKSHLKKLRKFLYNIPENDFVLINVSDWNIISYLGLSKKISRRQAGIIGYAMKHKWGKNILENVFFINKMKGLICGFSHADLQNIPIKVIARIEESVFNNVWACTQQQLKILLNIALKGNENLEMWTNETVQKVGFLMAFFQPSDFKKLKPQTFKGLKYNVMKMMRVEQVNEFSQKQVSFLDEQTLMLLRKKIETFNKDNGMVATKPLDFIVTLWIVFIMKSF